MDIVKKYANIIGDLKDGEKKSVDFFIPTEDFPYLINEGCMPQGELNREIIRFAGNPVVKPVVRELIISKK